MIALLDILGSPYVGVYLVAGGGAVAAPPGLPDHVAREARTALGLPMVVTTLGGTSVLGSLAVGNANGLVVSDIATENEVTALQAAGITVTVVASRFNALGNLFLVNDHGGVAHPALPGKLVEKVGRALAVPIHRHELAGLRTPGSGALATNRGVLLHPKATEDDERTLSEALGVPARRGTLNYGSPYVGSAAVATDNGVVVGRTTTGPELNRLEDALDLIRPVA